MKILITKQIEEIEYRGTAGVSGKDDLYQENRAH